MNVRTLGATLGIAALSAFCWTAPAQATDGLDSVRVYYPADAGNGGDVRARIDFVSRTEVIFRDFAVRDVCPGDGLPVRARVEWFYSDGTLGAGAWRAVTSGCSRESTSFGDIRVSRTRAVTKVRVTVCVYTTSAGNRACANSTGRDNQYV